MIKIYLWKMKGSNVGHLAMKLTDGTYISFWPAEELEFKRKKRSGTHTYEDDVEAEGRSADEVLDLPYDIVDQDKIKTWWSGYVDKNKYHLLSNNCALVVKQALHVGDIYESAYVQEGGVNRFGLMNTPVEVFEWAGACKKLYPGREGESILDKIFSSIGNFFK